MGDVAEPRVKRHHSGGTLDELVCLEHEVWGGMFFEPRAARALAAELVAMADDIDEDSDAEPLFYVQDTRCFVGNCVMWWCPDGKGYTTVVAEAGLYTAERAARMRDTDKPWPRATVERLARGRVDMQLLPSEDSDDV